MDGESHAFSSQVLEIDRAFENLARSGKLYPLKGQPQQHSSHYAQGASPLQRFATTSHYATQRQSNLPSNRFYGDARSTSQSLGMNDYGNQYYPPPPLQQQYSHSQQHDALSKTPSANYAASYRPEQAMNDLTQAPYSQFSNSGPAAQQTALSMPQDGPRSFSPFGGSQTLPPLSRLNTGGAGSSSHSTTPSISAAMSSSTSMLPPGYGRESFASVAPSHVHSRAHSITGTLTSLSTGQYARDALTHSRAQSIGQHNDNLRSTMMSNMNSSSTGVFSPSIGHSRAASISAGSNGTNSPSAATFNFFAGPSTSTTAPGSSSAQPTYSSIYAASSSSRIAPIARPSQSRSIPESVDEPRVGSRNTGGLAFSSVPASSVTSPLSNGFTDGWLDQIASSTSPTTSTRSMSLSEAQRKSLQSVWNN